MSVFEDCIFTFTFFSERWWINLLEQELCTYGLRVNWHHWTVPLAFSKIQQLFGLYICM